MKGYTTPLSVQSQLGRTLTPDQITYLNQSIIPAVEEWIDTTGGRAYGEGAVLSEPLVMSGQYTWLTKAPIQSVEAVRGWYWGQSASGMFTLDPLLYTLIDPSNGYFYLPSWRGYAHLEVDYTPNPAIPERIKLAAAILCGVFMRTVLHPQTEWLTSYASAQDVNLKFRDMKIPDQVYDLLGSTGYSVTVA